MFYQNMWICLQFASLVRDRTTAKSFWVDSGATCRAHRSSGASGASAPSLAPTLGSGEHIKFSGYFPQFPVWIQAMMLQDHKHTHFFVLPVHSIIFSLAWKLHFKFPIDTWIVYYVNFFLPSGIEIYQKIYMVRRQEMKFDPLVVPQLKAMWKWSKMSQTGISNAPRSILTRWFQVAIEISATLECPALTNQFLRKYN